MGEKNIECQHNGQQRVKCLMSGESPANLGFTWKLWENPLVFWVTNQSAVIQTFKVFRIPFWHLANLYNTF